MGLYENIRDIAKSRGYSVNRLEQELGFARSSINKFNKNTPSADKIQQIADFLGTTTDSLLSGKLSGENTSHNGDSLTARDKRDIAKDLDRIMEEIANDTDGPLYYNDQPIPKNKIDLLRNAIEVALEDAKVKNKETFRPYKHKPRPEKN